MRVRHSQVGPALSLSFGFAALAVAIPAGGLGAAPAAGIAGAIAGAWMLLGGARPTLRVFVWLVAAFTAWSALSFAWSAYEHPDQLIQMLAMVPPAAAFIWAASRLRGVSQDVVSGLVVFAALFAAGILALEAMNAGAATRAFRPLDEDQILVLRNLGHGASTLVVLAPAAVILAWSAGGFAGRAAAVAIAGLALLAAFAFGITANVFGLAAAIAAATLAAARPVFALRACLYGSAGLIAFAPLLGWAAATAGVAWRETMPISWASRLEAWRVVSAKIWEAPLFGHGFDSVRLVVEPVVVQGVAMKAVRMHPHNVGLHIWYETGAIGALLAAAAFVAAASALTSHASGSRARAMAICGAIACIAAINGVSYGVWQPWWIASCATGLGAALLVGPRRE